jgi:hypothetical protein
VASGLEPRAGVESGLSSPVGVTNELTGVVETGTGFGFVAHAASVTTSMNIKSD